jgi:hypothetical protein
MKNRIINGAMVIDQRNAGASVTPASGNTYTLDRWVALTDQASKFSVEQTISGVSAPSGFTDYLGVTSLSAYTVASGEQFQIAQFVEGYNVADLGWGTASAKTVTLSFWVRSSLTGTFGGALQNSASDRSYPFSYSISSVNTWEYKTITIAGDTSGTWLTTSGRGIKVLLSLGTGSTYLGTAGAWSASNVTSATGETKVLATNGATLYLTGVQLEVGSTATSFDYRPYGTELALCQRYYIRYVNGTSQIFGNGDRYASTGIQCTTPLQTEMRTAPSLVSTTGSSYYLFAQAGTDHTFNSLTINSSTTTKVATTFNSGDTSATAGQAGLFKSNNASASVAFSAEL